MAVRTDCRHYSSRTVTSGEVVQRCRARRGGADAVRLPGGVPCSSSRADHRRRLEPRARLPLTKRSRLRVPGPAPPACRHRHSRVTSPGPTAPRQSWSRSDGSTSLNRPVPVRRCPPGKALDRSRRVAGLDAEVDQGLGGGIGPRSAHLQRGDGLGIDVGSDQGGHLRGDLSAAPSCRVRRSVPDPVVGGSRPRHRVSVTQRHPWLDYRGMAAASCRPCSAKRSSSVNRSPTPVWSACRSRFGYKRWMRIRATAVFERVIYNCFVTDRRGPSVRCSDGRPAAGRRRRWSVLLPVPQFMALVGGPGGRADAASAVGPGSTWSATGVAHLSFPDLAARRRRLTRRSARCRWGGQRKPARPAERR